MAQIGLHAYIALSLKKKLPKKQWFFVSFLFGSIVPDIDALFTFIASLFMPLEESLIVFHRTFSHNIFIVIILYLICLAIYEFKKNKNYLHIANGMILGMSLHLFIDIFLWFDAIHLFWPLPLERLDMWPNFSPSNFITKTLMIFEFVFLRLFAWEMTKIIIETPGRNGSSLQSLNYFMKTQLIFIVTFLIVSYFLNGVIIYYIFSLFYIPSIMMAIFYVFELRTNINEYMFLKVREKEYSQSTSRKTPIRNIQ